MTPFSYTARPAWHERKSPVRLAWLLIGAAIIATLLLACSGCQWPGVDKPRQPHRYTPVEDPWNAK